jgi:UPF0755 protein
MPDEISLHRSRLNIFVLGTAGILVLIAAGIDLISRTPTNFVPDTIVHVENNMPLSSVANELSSDHIIRSPILFRVITTLLNGRHGVGAGDYAFYTPQSLWQVALRLVHNEQGLTAVRVTIPEGMTVKQIGDILNLAFTTDATTSTASSSKVQSQFSESVFLSLASTSEGYLFPDTYFFLPNVSATTIISVMKNNFNQKMQSIAGAITASGHSVHDVVIMASILEKEATSTADRRIISGILWKRLDNGDFLQIDPPIIYAKSLAGEKIARDGSLTRADLATTSPYNTYKYKGLPPGPIDNPGLDALVDAITPTATDYWYYLSGGNGMIHYATTYAGHLANAAKYMTN